MIPRYRIMAYQRALIYPGIDADRLASIVRSMSMNHPSKFCQQHHVRLLDGAVRTTISINVSSSQESHQ